MIFLLFIFCLCISYANCIIYTLQNLGAPGGAYGGAAFINQPSISVVDPDGLLVTGFVGSAYAVMGSSPSGFEPLLVGTCDKVSCGVASSITTSIVPFVGGVAQFTDLMIQTAASGYVIQYIGLDSTDSSFAFVDSSSFDVAIGDVYKLSFETYIGTASGGKSFLPNPTVIVTDRGGNLVASAGTTTASIVTAYVSTVPEGSGPVQLGAGGFTDSAIAISNLLNVRLFKGVATFTQLYLNQSGSNYRLSFASDLGIDVLESSPFDVSIGSAGMLTIEEGTGLSTVPVESGEYLVVTPRIVLRDLGGNVVDFDSTSAVQVSINDNPSQAILGLSTSLFVVAVEGYASFTALTLDKAGNGFSLIFQLYTYSSSTNEYTLDSAVSVVTPSFDVVVGPPRAITSTVYADRAWAGGQPFTVQPVLNLLDYGGNVLAYDFTTVLTGSMVSSLVSDYRLKVDSSVWTGSNTVKRVTASIASGIYGVGETIYFYVEFVYPFSLIDGSSDNEPYLSLTMDSYLGSSPIATFVNNSVVGEESSIMTFSYDVVDGDTATVGVTYSNTASMYLNGWRIVDGNENSFSVFLPNPPSVNADIVLDTSAPTITDITTFTTADTYGAGENIIFHVNFSAPVIVSGAPNIKLTVQNSTSYVTADFVSVLNSDNVVLVFEYNVAFGEESDAGGLTLNSDIQLPNSATILRKTTNPTTAADLTVSASIRSTFLSTYGIIVNATSAPALNSTYGVQTDHSAGVYYPGEVILITVQFDQPIVTQGISMFLHVNTGRSTTEQAVITQVYDDEKTIEFSYVVIDGLDHTNFDIADMSVALEIPAALAGATENYIKRKATVPTTDANTTTTGVYYSGKSIRDQVDIQLYGLTPIVSVISLESVVLASGHSGTVLYPDDIVYINVTFTTRITSTCSPVFVMDISEADDELLMREAVYVSGNNTNQYIFSYTVAVGDISSYVAYRYTPNALCLETGCPAVTTCLMEASSTSPGLSLDKTLSQTGGLPAYGVPIDGTSSYTVTNTLMGRNTTIVSVTCRTTDKEVGVGDFLYFDVLFTDEVTKIGSTAPTLYLSTDTYGDYAGGIGTNTLAFAYLTKTGDDIGSVEPALVDTSTAIFCPPFTCNITNINGVNADLNMTAADVMSIPNVTIVTDAPVVSNIFTDKETSIYDGFYSVGETIDIVVVFSKPILISPPNPSLRLDLNTTTPRYAIMDTDRSTSTRLYFTLTIIAGDYTEDLQVYDVDSLTQELGSMYRLADNPSTLVNGTLPTPAPLARNGNIVKVVTAELPQVSQIVSLSPDGTYAAGDMLYLRMDLSQYVIVNGICYIQLRMGNQIALAAYIGSEASYNISLYKEPTKTLYFSVTISENDFNPKLDYIDLHSFTLGVNEVNDLTTIRRVASVPTQRCSLFLPHPGTTGSLSNSSTLYIEGHAPYMTSITIASHSVDTVTVGEPVEILMNFSAPVEVNTTGGVPYIVMETGNTDRLASYTSGSSTSTLIFTYVPQPGDTANPLDYQVDRARSGSATASFQLNGGQILSYSTVESIAAATVYMNPVSGELSGSLDATAIAGNFQYLDLVVREQGPDYQMRFSTSPPTAFRTISSVQPLFVSFSNEFEMLPAAAQVGEMVGSKVNVYDDVAVLGAPHTNLSITTVQTISSVAKSGDPTMEVQIIRAEVDPQPAIFEIHTTADVGETVGGYFSIWYGTQGPSRGIPSNVDPLTLQAILKYDIPSMGTVTATKTPYIYCACHNAFSWVLTLNDITEGVFPDIVLVSTELTGSGASVAGPSMTQYPALLAGTFTLTSSLGQTSDPLPYDATEAEMAAAIGELGLQAAVVNIGPSYATRSRSWTVTYEAYLGSYEMPLVEQGENPGPEHGLTGGVTTRVWTEVLRAGVHGPGGLSGTFQIEWRGNTTTHIPFNATAADVKAALEALPVINFVNVGRSMSDINTYTWVVEFVEVNHNTPRGYFVDDTHNAEPMIGINHLIGTDTELVVNSRYAWGSRNTLDGFQRQGTYGDKAGAVYVFQQLGSSWVEMATLTGSDTAEADQFGSSVSLFGDSLLVGAVGANMNGYFEVQELQCNATGGYFQVGFRGWVSEQIPYNVSLQEMKETYLVANPDIFSGLHPIRSVSINTFETSAAFCDGYKVRVTFHSPLEGAPLVNDGVDNGPDLELLTLYQSELTGGWVVVEELQTGTIRPQNTNSDHQQQGSAYLFQANYSCSATDANCLKSSWPQVQQFFPQEPITGFERFGFSVSVTDEVCVVGAPGTNLGAGAVYVYTLGDSGDWVMAQDPLFLLQLQPGDNFGHVVRAENDTIIIGAPYTANSTGTTYAFKRASTAGAPFIFTQFVTPPDDYYMDKSQYGYSAALEQNTLVIGANMMDSKTIYFGKRPSLTRRLKAGSVFIFKRENMEEKFKFSQVLEPTNVKAYDSFGQSVAINSNTIMVGSVEHFSGKLQPSRTIVRIQTVADYSDKHIGSEFVLQWKALNVTAGGGYLTTRLLSHDISATVLKEVLQEDLLTGDLIVSRSNVDVYNGGYEWLVTFLDQDKPIPLFVPDTTRLEGPNARVDVNFVNPYPTRLRAKTHVFQLYDPAADDSLFVEQLFVSPFSNQPMDLCGSDVSIYGEYAFVGCPNRDSAVSNFNTGSGIIYYLSLLKVQFRSPTIAVAENNGTCTMIVDRFVNTGALVTSEAADAYFFIQSIDRNIEYLTQEFLQYLYGVKDEDYMYPDTIADTIGVYGTALARTQYYGSEHTESLWIDGRFDYRGLGDYTAIKDPIAFLMEYDTFENQMTINPDTIYEFPDENITLMINSPGIWPSPLGRLVTTVTIENTNDGVVDSREVYTKLYEEASNSDVEVPVGVSSDELLETFPVSGHAIGKVVVVDDDIGVMVTGCPITSVEIRTIDNRELSTTFIEEAGRIFVYTKANTTEKWAQSYQNFTSPFLTVNTSINMHFGEAVAVQRLHERNFAIMAVTEPGLNSVHIYIDGDMGMSKSTTYDLGAYWNYSTTLSMADEAFLPQHRYGEVGTLALSGYLLVVGAPGLEAVYVYQWSYYTNTSDPDIAHLVGLNGTSSWYWTEGVRIRASDYDYDVLTGVDFVHRQEYGKSVAVSGRTIVVGAPYADYDNLGSSYVEFDWNTEGTDIFATGRGQVYVIDSSPAKQVLTLYAAQTLTTGDFILQNSFQGMVTNTTNLSYASTAEEMVVALEALDNIDDVVVTIDAENNGLLGVKYIWSITFNSAFQTPSVLTPLWTGFGCPDCNAFDADSSGTAAEQMLCVAYSDLTSLVEVQVLHANDRRQGDRFGYTLALDGDQLAVSATYSAAVTTTTWDFEAGILEGWSITGTAFSNQPTFGDNPRFRHAVGQDDTKRGSMGYAKGPSSRLSGTYFVGTYELRPGDSTDYTSADSSYPEGTIRGDDPQGTMTSQVFMIRGTQISFLIGGGCDIYKEYVELSIDGLSVGRVSGECSDIMKRVYFDVSLFSLRAAQITVVDVSSSHWGHINVDDFKFNWDVKGAMINGTEGRTNRVMFGGAVETPQSGAVYAFRRQVTDGIDNCGNNDAAVSCSWYEESRLTASDKRTGDLFGSSVAVNDAAGVIVVGSPNAILTGFYKEIPSVYPHHANVEVAGNEESTASGPQWPLISWRDHLYQNLPSYAAVQPSGARAISFEQHLLGLYSDSRAYLQTGALYVFAKTAAVLDSTGIVSTQQYWDIIETAKIQPPDAQGRDNFAQSVSISGPTIVAGSAGHDGYQPDAGALYMYDAGFAAVTFKEPLIVVIAGTDTFASVNLVRDSSIYAHPVHLAYATSDLTATSVDADKYTACGLLPTSTRGINECGDYQQTSGTISFDTGVDTAGFTVPIVNSLCGTRKMKYIQITISVPGSGAIQGQKLSGTIRIDPDEFADTICT